MDQNLKDLGALAGILDNDGQLKLDFFENPSKALASFAGKESALESFLDWTAKENAFHALAAPPGDLI